MGAIGLNPIRLDRIGLDPIRINAIRLGVPGAASGSDRPYIDPEVLASLKAVCICYGKSNDDPDRAIVKNLVDPDNPFIISNAAYKLNSGYGKYSIDFLDSTIWNSSNSTITSDKIDCKQAASHIMLLYYSVGSKEYPDIPSFQVIKTGADIDYSYIDETGAPKSIRIVDGINTLPASHNTLYTGAGRFCGFGNPGIGNSVTLTQIPSYQGAFVTDGVDDLITSTKTVQEMGVTDEVTVVSMIHQITLNPTFGIATTNYIENGSTREHVRSDVYRDGKTGIYGYSASLINNIKSDINNILGDKADYVTKSTNSSQSIFDSKFSVVGRTIDISEVSSVAWYWTVIANKVLTTDQINQVIDYYNLDRCVEPTVWYDVQKQGLSNDTPDSDWYLKDYSGNGYDMTLYNYAKTPESGINEGGGLQSDGVDDYGKVTGLPIYKDYTVVADYVRTFAKENVQDAPILSKSQVAGDGAFLFNYLNVNSVISSYSFGTNNVLTNVSDSERKIYYQSKYVNGGKSINSGTGTDYDSMWLGTYRDDSQIFFTGAIYSLMTFPYSLSEFLIERQLKKHKLGTLYPDMVEFRPVIKSNVELATKLTFVIRGTSTLLNAGDYIPKDSELWVIVTMNNLVDELTKFSINGKEITIPSSAYNPATGKYGFPFVIDDKSPQKIDITIDEYIRYEDIVQPYPAIVTLKQDGKDITWGDKLKVGDEVTFVTHTNLLPNLYTVSGAMYYNGKFMYGNTPITVAKSMTFTTVHNYIKSNEPKCILSPSRLRIPNSSYKILGYIPDISGHGNHGKINNSAYALNSGANGYLVDFNSWVKTENVTLTDNKITVIKDKITYQWISYATNGSIVPTFKVNISGIPNGGRLDLFDNNGTIQTLTNGVNDIEGFTANGATGFLIYSGLELDWSNLVIEQVGLYEGAYCLDGVDDFITIPTLSSGGKQVLMKVNWQSSIGQGMLYDQRGTAFAIWNSDKYNDDETDTIPAYSARNGGNTYIDGILNKNILASQLRNITHNIVATNTMLNGSSVSPTIGCRTEHDAYFTNMSLYDFMLFDEISTDEEILTLNEYVGIEGNTDDLFTENN